MVTSGSSTSEFATLKIALTILTVLTSVGTSAMAALHPEGLAYAIVAGLVAIMGVAVKYISARQAVKVAASIGPEVAPIEKK